MQQTVGIYFPGTHGQNNDSFEHIHQKYIYISGKLPTGLIEAGCVQILMCAPHTIHHLLHISTYFYNLLLSQTSLL